MSLINILGITISNHLSVSDHIRDVISKCAQSLFAFKVLRCHGMNNEAVVIAKLLYASPAWWRFATAADKQRVEAFVRRGVRHGLYRASDPTPTQLAEASDDNLFNNVLTNSNHVLKPLLPDKSNHHYNLRHRRHTLTLSIKTDARNFVVRQLFRDMY